MKVIFYYCADTQLYQIARLVGKEASKKTLIGMLNKIRESCVQTNIFNNESLVFGGDVEMISNVEMDESSFGKKRKNNRGKEYKKQWVFGITERNSNKVFMTVVDDRKKTTLLPLIRKHISTRSTLHHDDWPSYRCLRGIGYSDLIVNHSKEFKSKQGACTNTIEGIWGVMKQRINRMHGIEFSKLNTYLQEYCFRYQHKHDICSAVVNSIAFSV